MVFHHLWTYGTHLGYLETRLHRNLPGDSNTAQLADRWSPSLEFPKAKMKVRCNGWPRSQQGKAKESPVLGCSWTSWMFLAGARWEMSGLDHSPQDHSRSSSHDVSVTQELEPMIEGVDEAIESAKSEVVSHPLKMEIEIEEEIKEDANICKSCVAVCGHVLTWLQRMTKHVAKNVERNRTKSVCSIVNISYLGKITADSLSSSANVLVKGHQGIPQRWGKEAAATGMIRPKGNPKKGNTTVKLSRILRNIWHHLAIATHDFVDTLPAELQHFELPRLQGCRWGSSADERNEFET